MTATAAPSNVVRFFSRPAGQAGLVAFITGVAAQIWSHRVGVVFAFWDAQAHLDIARRVVDSATPGLQMLGTVWLPVPHLLLLPFTLVDRWWWNGVAGGIVGLAAYVTIVACLHDLLTRHVRDVRLAWLGTVFVVLNPSLLYLQTTAMTEPVLLACMVASVAALDRWSAGGRRRTLMVAGCLGALAVGSRYDGWFYLLLATPVVAWLAWRGERAVVPSSRQVPAGVEPATTFSRDADATASTTSSATVHRAWWRSVLIFALPSTIVVAAWLAYNAKYFGDALAFQRGIWSAQAQQALLATREQVPTAGHVVWSTGYYIGAVLLCAGAVLTVLGLLSTVLVLRRGRTAVVPLLLLTALPFNILALAAQQSVIQLPWTHPAGVLNLRYGVMLVPGLATMLALGGARLLEYRPRWRKGMLLAGLISILMQGAWFAADWPSHVGALREGLAIRDGDRRQQQASDWLAVHYDGGRVLVDEAVNLSPRTRIALRDRVYRWTWQLGAAALSAPERAVDWVVVDVHHDTGVVEQAIAQRDQFKHRFDLAFDEGGLEIWRRR